MTAIDFAAFVDQLAAVSGETIRPFFRTALGVENKSRSGGFDPVTAADRTAEAAMRALIKQTFPEHGILGEEFDAERPDAEYVWVLDPIDGTKSFICGMPAWGTLIALTRRGEPIYGMMHQPFTREHFTGDGSAASYRGPAGDRRERHFVNVASFGLGGEAVQRVRGWSRIFPGRARYLAAALPTLAAGRAFHLRLWLDDAAPVEFHATTVALANGRYQGGGILIAPQAAIDDGLIDVTLVERVCLAEVAANLRLLYSGDIWSHPKVHHWCAARVRAEAETATPLEMDGEPVGTLPLEAEVLPRALRLILPAATAPLPAPPRRRIPIPRRPYS